jgi:sugar lactone lactonase YvrE
MTLLQFEALPVPACALGESPTWHPAEQALYWCDIPGRRLHRWEPVTASHRQWDFEAEPACCVPAMGGGLLIAMRDGVWRFDPASGRREAVTDPPYDPRVERFNDGKADAVGRFWIGTIYEPREPALAALYRYSRAAGLERMADGITTSNGLAFSPDGRTLYWADTRAHAIDRIDIDLATGALSGRRPFARFPARVADRPLTEYGGRPDGAAVDSEGAYWVAMFEGQRLLRLAPDGSLLADIPLPVRCPTMVCFGGADLRTLYLTSARDKRPAEELAAQPMAGRVLQARVDVPGLPAAFAWP